jgi:hypothetical protein
MGNWKSISVPRRKCDELEAQMKHGRRMDRWALGMKMSVARSIVEVLYVQPKNTNSAGFAQMIFYANNPSLPERPAVLAPWVLLRWATHGASTVGVRGVPISL